MKRALFLAAALAACASPPPPVVPPRPAPLTNDLTPDAEWRKTPPAPGPVGTFTPPSVRVETLSNGLRLFIAPSTTNVLAARIVLPGPSAYPSERAFAMMVTVSATQSENAAVRRELEKSLVRWGSVRGPDYFAADFATLPNAADVVLRAIASFVGPAKLDPAALDLNAPLIAGDLAGRTQYRSGAAWVTLLRVTLGDAHPYTRISNDAGGSTPSVDHAEAARIHDALYDPSLASLVLTGAVDEAVLASARRELGAWKSAAHAKPAPPPVAKPSTTARLVVVDWPGSTSAEIRGGAPAPERASADWSPFVVALDALTARPTSRLRAVVEGADPGISPRAEVIALRGEGLFHLHCSARTEAVATTIAASEKAFQSLVTNPLDGDELAALRTYERLSYPARFDASADVAPFVAEIPIFGLSLAEPSLGLTRFVEAPPAEVARVARERLGAVRWVVVGDWSTLKVPLRKLGLGTIELRSANGERVGADDGS